MALKIYQKFGLRRDQNLEDITRPEVALTNVLNNIEDGTIFKAEDLSVIKGMYSQGLEQDTFLEVGGSAEQSTDLNGETSPLTPYISYQNRLDLSALYAGTPRIYGGDGPNSRYYDFTQVPITSSLTTNPLDNNGVWIADTEPIAEDLFWERGQFAWNRKLHEKSADVGGGIEWEGYYVPTGTGRHFFTISSTGCWTFDFQKEDYGNAFQPGDDWDITSSTPQTNNVIYSNQLTDTHTTIYKNYAFIKPEVDVQCHRYVDTDNSTGTILQITNEEDYNKVAIGMTCINSTYIEGGNDGAVVTDYNSVNGRITLGDTLVDGSTNENPVKDTLTATSNPSTNPDITFVQATNQSTSAQFKIDYSLTKGTPYRFKLRYFIPQDWDANRSERFLRITESVPDGGTSNQLNYKKLYNLRYDFSEKSKGSFNKFLDNSILFGGGTTGGTTHANYTAVKTTKKIDGRYDPINLTLTNDYDSSIINGKKYPYKRIEIWEGDVEVAEFATSMAISDTSGIEVGNYLYDHSWATGGGTGTKHIPDGTRIVEVIANSTIVLSSAFTASGTATFKIIEHRGHIKRIVADTNSISSSLELVNTSTGFSDGTSEVIKKKMIVVGSNLPINTQVLIRPTTDTILTLTSNPTTSGVTQNLPYYIYDYQGLINDSMLAFCEPDTDPDENICLTVESDIPIGTSSITFSTSQVSLDAWNSIPNNNSNRILGFYFAPNTTATKTNGTGNVRGTLNLSTPTVKLIREGNNFTVTADTGTEDKSLCCPPKDTAPPFEATDDGMVTVEDHETLDVLSGNVKFDNIRATIKSDEIVEPGGSITYDTFLGDTLNKAIRFKSTTDGHTYRLLVST